MSKLEQIAAIGNTAEAVNGDVRDNYSGRGMFGKTCYAIDCNDPVHTIIEAGKNGLPTPKIDNMGKGFIVYWPSISL